MDYIKSKSLDGKVHVYSVDEIFRTIEQKVNEYSQKTVRRPNYLKIPISFSNVVYPSFHCRITSEQLPMGLKIAFYKDLLICPTASINELHEIEVF